MVNFICSSISSQTHEGGVEKQNYNIHLNKYDMFFWNFSRHSRYTASPRYILRLGDDMNIHTAEREYLRKNMLLLGFSWNAKTMSLLQLHPHPPNYKEHIWIKDIYIHKFKEDLKKSVTLLPFTNIPDQTYTHDDKSIILKNNISWTIWNCFAARHNRQPQKKPTQQNQESKDT